MENHVAWISVLVSVMLCKPSSAVVYVSAGGTGDGSSWNTPLASIQAGIDSAAVKPLGDEVWVKKGTYYECITLKQNVHLYGGFAGDETQRGGRDPVTNRTVMDGRRAGTVVNISSVTISTVDGFVIANGKGPGIACDGSSPTIANNTIRGNHGYMSDSRPYVWHAGPGIACYWSSGTIVDNIIGDNFDGGIECEYSSPIIARNTIAGNHAGWNGGGITCEYSSSPTILNNTITGNKAAWGGGVFCYYSSPTIAGNLISHNRGSCGGMNCEYSSPLIAGNTVVSNLGDSVGGINCSQSSPTIANNVIALNSSGISGEEYGGSEPVLRSNCLYNPKGYDYRWVAPGTGDIVADPLFLAPWVDEYHVRAGSPCIGAGDNSFVQTAWTDLDGKPRVLPLGGVTDIGCFEWDATPYWVRTVGQAKAVPESFDIELRRKPVSAVFERLDPSKWLCTKGSYSIGNSWLVLAGMGRGRGSEVQSVSEFLYKTVEIKAVADDWRVDTSIGVELWAPDGYHYGIVVTNGNFGVIRSKPDDIHENYQMIPCWGQLVGEQKQGQAHTFLFTWNEHVAGVQICDAQGNQMCDLSYDDRQAHEDHEDPQVPDCPLKVRLNASDRDYDASSHSGPDELRVDSVYVGGALYGHFLDGPKAFYVEEGDRSCGIRVLTDQPVAKGDLCTLAGHLTTDGGERSLWSTAVNRQPGTGSVPGALGMPNRSIGGGNYQYSTTPESRGQEGVMAGYGLSNIGLSIRSWGTLARIGDSSFTLDDGCGMRVKCILPGGVALRADWAYVGVTGIASCERSGDGLVPLVRVRAIDDVVPYAIAP